MPDQDKDLVRLFVHDLDDIELPPRDRWRPAPRKESLLMKTRQYVLFASAVAAVLVLALIASFVLRGGNQVAASPTPTSTITAALATPTSATASPVATTSPTPAASPVGAITGRIPYPAGFQPALTVYAISVADQRTYFSVSSPRYAEGTTGPGRGTYTITGVAPGTYYVLAYRDSDIGANDQPGLYSQFVIRCVQPSLAGSPVPEDCNARTGPDHVLVQVTVGAGETASRIDVGDWVFEQATYPLRPR
jgi:hypothetical protein